MEETQISRIMIQKPVTVHEDTPLLEAAQILHTMKFGGLPVVRDGKLVGIVTDNDLHGCLAQLLGQGG
jgi:CBS domain-containing protein